MRAKLRSLLRLAWPYLVMVMLPVISVLFLSTYILNTHTKQIVEDKNRALSVAVDRVDQKLQSITDLSYMIAENDMVLDYVIDGMTHGTDEAFAYDDIQDLLSGVSQNDNIAEIYFYDANTGRIIASETSLSNAEMFFRYRYRFTNATAEEAVQRLQTSRWGYGYSSAEEVFVNNKPLDVIEYRLSVPADRFGVHQSQLIISLNTGSLLRDLLDELQEGASFCIYDDDRLIFSSAENCPVLEDCELTSNLEKQRQLKGKPYAAEYLFNNGSWRIHFLYPQISQAKNVHTVVNRLLPAIVIPVLLSIILCVYFTHKSHKEISEILMLLRGAQETEEPQKEPQYVNHELIRSYAGQIMEKNTAYQTKLREARASQKSSVLSRLLRNAYRSQEEKSKALASVDLQIGEEPCAALCVQFDDICNEFFTINNITVRDMIVDLLVNHTEVKVEVLDSLPTEIAGVLAANAGFETVIDEIVSMLNVRIAYEYGVDLRIGVGNAVPSIYDIHRSYEQAKEVIRYGESAGKNIRIYDRMDAMDEVVFYPVMTDDKISNYMIAGRAEEAKEVIRDIYTENFKKETKMLSLEAVALLRYRVTNAVTSVAEKQGISVHGDTKKILTEKSVSKYFAALTELVDLIVKEIMTKKSNAQNVLAVKVREYIEEHYMDCGLSIKQIANSFHFHENYISNLYKEEYGENLSNAIERLRIEKASQLLQTTNIRIGEVAAAVGYSSDSSFRRAFKKITGVSPVDYRSSH